MKKLKNIRVDSTNVGPPKLSQVVSLHAGFKSFLLFLLLQPFRNPRLPTRILNKWFQSPHELWDPAVDCHIYSGFAVTIGSFWRCSELTKKLNKPLIIRVPVRAEKMKSRGPVGVCIIRVYAALEKEAKQLDVPATAENMVTLAVSDVDIGTCIYECAYHRHVGAVNGPE
jgi:hypothetical protein